MNTTSPSPQNLSISLLGHPEIRVDGVAIEDKFQTKVLALLVYLAAERRPHSREQLIDLFWPDVEPETGRSNLRVTLYRLRQNLGDERYLRSTRESLLLDPDECRVDAIEFLHPYSQAASPAQLESRLALYRGEFFGGGTLDGCPDFSDWLANKREVYHAYALTLADKVIARHEENGDFASALRHAGRRLELAPWGEEGHRKTMELLARDGQSGAALAQYEICKKVLVKELGASPDRKTTELFERIKAGKLTPEVAKRRPFSFLGQTAGTPLRRPLNVLIVDDHLLFRAGLTMMLDEFGPDVTVFEAASCEDALALPEPQPGFDIIMLDLKFPGMSGLDGLLLFRNRFPSVPVVLFSSDEEATVIQASRERGAKGYLSKGMDAEGIVKGLEQVLSGGEAFPFGLGGQ